MLVAVAVFAAGTAAVAGDAREPDVVIRMPLQGGTAAPTVLPEVLDLGTARAMALRDNPSLKTIEDRVGQAKQRVKQARAAFFPLIETSLSVTKARLDQNSFEQQRQVNSLLQNQAQQQSQLDEQLAQFSQLPGLSTPVEFVQVFSNAFTRSEEPIDREYSDHRLSFTASWQIFDGLTREFTYKAARIAYKEAGVAGLEAKRLLLNAVATSYYSAILAREDITTAKANKSFNGRLHREAKVSYDAGAVAYSDVLNFEVRGNQAKAQLILAENNYKVAMVGLAQLMGVREGRLPEGIRLAPLEEAAAHEMEIPDPEAAMTLALTQRPDFMQKEYAIERGNATAKAWRGRLFPSIGLSATEAATVRHNPKFSRDDFAGALSVGLNYTIFAGGRNRARWAEAKIASSEARHDRNALEIEVLGEVQTVFDNLKAAQQQLVLQRSTAALVEENRGLVEKEYRVGQTSLVRLNEAQRDLVQAQVQLSIARVSLHQAWHDLRTATAETLVPYLDD